MHQQRSYGQFCPVAMAAEILCSRWTVLIIRELLCGTTRFNDLRRGVPKMSPTLLSKRLKELEDAGVIESVPSSKQAAMEYRLTRAGNDLRTIVLGMGFWGQRWVDSHLTLKEVDPSLLMWDIRRRLDPTPMPPRRCTIMFEFPEIRPAQRKWWLVIDQGKVDLCGFDPGYEVDLYVRAPLKSMTAIWLGLTSTSKQQAEGLLEILGNRDLAKSMQRWLGLSVFAKEKKLAATVVRSTQVERPRIDG